MPRISGIFGALEISASGMSAQRAKIDVISSNVANVHTTRVEGGSYYKRQVIVLRESKLSLDFSSILSDEIGGGIGGELSGVEVVEITSIQEPPKFIYEPNHPDANEEGMVSYPNINIIEEMVNMIMSSRAFEANLTVFNTAKEMISQSLEI
ncbi:MAG: flagellar basal body rod protein FlgC [Candidatus Marinimicrobia bacterium]|nr:flagellar basal body rod protein FlgC [Candidatus Neomarinimicrobiota bacterium]